VFSRVVPGRGKEKGRGSTSRSKNSSVVWGTLPTVLYPLGIMYFGGFGTCLKSSCEQEGREYKKHNCEFNNGDTLVLQ